MSLRAAVGVRTLATGVATMTTDTTAIRIRVEPTPASDREAMLEGLRVSG